MTDFHSIFVRHPQTLVVFTSHPHLGWQHFRYSVAPRGQWLLHQVARWMVVERQARSPALGPTTLGVMGGPQSTGTGQPSMTLMSLLGLAGCRVLA